MQIPKYSLRVFWSEPDKAFIVTCPEFPGLSAFGSTQIAAVQQANIALQMFIEDVQESGEALPIPQTAHAHSGKFQLRIDKNLHRQATELADAAGISLNKYVEDALRMKVTEEQVGKQVIDQLRKEFAKDRITSASIVMAGHPPVHTRTRKVKTIQETLTEDTVSMVTLRENEKDN
jgi:predicted HicB family RNase H-like nuclease